MSGPGENSYTTGMEVAVIGMSGRLPGAGNIHEFWENLKNGVEAIYYFTDEELDQWGIDSQLLKNPGYVKAKGVLEGVEYFDADFFDYTPSDAKIMDPQLRVFHECTWEALEDAGYVPGSYKGLIGLYAAASTNIPWFCYSTAAADNPSQQFAVQAMNENHSFSTRISFTLNLQGPGFTLQTACSSSLTAIHLAYLGLMGGECDIALSGGVVVTHPQKNGYLYQDEMIRSPDGHCRAFDAKAKGTVAGDGAAVVVLKRLEPALEDRDHIYAVIRDTACNNDGRRKVGYTAPSIEGQAQVIRVAYQRAEIDPKTIGYIETHGTGTPLGDPLEIQALKLAFPRDKKGFCALGSVKTNIGHLDAAAGVTGFIKAVLTLKHRLIPPSLHFETLNPKIDLENSPFYINTRLSPFKNRRYPLRAAVSSFGIGGTNVHIILEEAPIAQSAERKAHGEFGQGRGGVSPPSGSRQYQLIILSARTQTALDKMTQNLVEYFKNSLLNQGNHENPVNPGLTLADAAYTLQVGRETFRHRKMIVCSDVPGVIRKLSTADPGDFYFSEVEEDNRPVVFMFPGQGAQYVNMGLELYEREPVFRKEMDRCLEILNTLMPYDIKEILYPGERKAQGAERKAKKRHALCAVRNAIDQTEITQPLLFAFEYALAKLLIKWGIKPGAMIGYSFGEYVAACLAGVFSLTDALTLVALRGRLMQQLPKGIMLSVPFPEEKLKPILDSQLSLAIVNGPSCIVSGTEPAIEAFEKKMKQRKCLCMRVNITAASHSQVMDSILEEFEEGVRQIVLKNPSIPFVSCVTGKWLTPPEAVNPTYWTNHLRETVRFVQGIDELLKNENTIFLEVGPGTDLSALVRRQTNNETNHAVINLIRHSQKNVSDIYFLLNKIGQLWLCGQEIDWQSFYTDERRYRIPLPTYPFDRQRYGFEGLTGDLFKFGAEILSGRMLPAKKSDLADWFYIPSWKRTMIPSSNSARPIEQSCVLVFRDTFGLGAGLVRQLERRKQEVVVVRNGEADEFSKTGPREYTINPTRGSHYAALLAELKKEGKKPGIIVHMWSITDNNREKTGPGVDVVDKVRESGLYSLLHLVKAIDKIDFQGDLKLVLISRHLHEITGREVLEPEKATLLGPMKVIPQEYPYIRCRSIDIILPEPGSWQEKALIHRLAAELFLESPDTVVAYRDNYRWVQTYEPVRLEEIPGSHHPLPQLKEKGVYLVTGGLGNIGLTLARYLAEAVKAKLVLTRRSSVPGREEWDQWLSEHHDKDPLSIKIKKLKEIENLGAEVLVFSVDAADREGMAQVIAVTESRFGPINGVIHAAGVVEGKSLNTINHLGPAEFKEQFHPKMYGLLVLADLLKDRELDFCLLISSLSPILGGLGLAAYASANLFMDTFVYKYNRANPGRWLSLNWGDWQIREEKYQETSLGGTVMQWAMTPGEGIETFRRILYYCENSQVIVSAGDLQTRINQWVKLGMPRAQDKTLKEKPLKLCRKPHVSDSYVPPRSEPEKTLVRLWQQLFGFEGIGIRDDFFELGGDSLKAITLAARLHRELDINLPLTEIFNKPCIEEMACLLESTGKNIYERIKSVEKKEYYPLSSAQKRLYILQRMEPASTAYNELAVFILEGNPLHFNDMSHARDRETYIKENENSDAIKLFNRLFSCLVERHENFRTSLHLVGSEPVQQIHERVNFKIEYNKKFCGGPGGGFSKEPPGRRRHYNTIKNFVRPFDLSRAPLLRVGLVKIDEGRYILMADMHHSITDAVSIAICIREIQALMTGKGLPTLRIRYKDYSQWQNRILTGKKMKSQESYWLKEFVENVPVLNLPVDNVRPGVRSFEGGGVFFELDRKETRALKDLANTKDVTIYMLLLAIYNIFLAKLSGTEDILVGVPTAGRKHAELEHIIGMFVNTLAVRNYPMGTKTFTAFLREVKTRTLEAFENQDYQYEELVERLSSKLTRDADRNPLFDTMLVLQNVEMPGIELPGLTVKPYTYDQWISKFDLTLQGLDTGEGLRFNFEYWRKIFKKETVEGFARRFKQVVCAVTRAPGSKISGIEIITQEEKQRLLEEFNDTERVYPEDKRLHELFEEQVERTPDRVALVGQILNKEVPFGGRVSITYRELNEKFHQLAHLLMEKGVGSDTIVGIMVERSIEMIVGILGILRAGAAYLPIDPDYPGERIDYMLAESNVRILVKKSNNFSHPTIGKGVDDIFIDDAIKKKRPKGTSLSGIWNLGSGISPRQGGQLAYIIYTSGTTGWPKGVMVEHGSAVNTLVCRKEEYQMNGDDISLQLFSYSFDGFVTSFFTPIISGSPVVLLSEEEIKDIGKITAVIVKHQVTHFISVPSLYSAIIESLTPGQASKLKIVTLAGERVGTNLLKNTIAKNSNMEISNEYGVTESAVMSTIYRHQQRDKVIKIGHPVWNTGIYILDRYNQLQPIGVAGELSLSGMGLARGYLNQPEMTAEKFKRAVNSHLSSVMSHSSKTSDRSSQLFPNDQCPMTNDRLYKTGDLARWLSDGNIEFFGRLDHQVKIRGFRIETSEIESRLSTHQGVKDAVVIDRDNGKGDKYLCAYFTAADVGSTPDSPALTDYLSERLPAFMIPAYFVLLNKLPLTPNGKLDRKALPAPPIGATEEYIAPADDIEKKLVNIWAEVLSIEKKAVGVKDNFFDLGGNSLKAMQVHSKVGNEFGKDIPAVMLFKYTTIRSFAANVIQEQNQVSTSRGDRSEARDRGRNKLKKLKRKVMEK